MFSLQTKHHRTYTVFQYHVCLFTVGDVSSETVESGGAYLFQLLNDKKRVTASEMHAIRNMFGPQTNAEVQAICDLVQK